MGIRTGGQYLDSLRDDRQMWIDGECVKDVTQDRRFAAADRHLHDSGVFYRVYEDPAGAERPWPLSHVPLLISAAEWQALEAGLVQRAELLEAVLADAYGPANLVREGRLPAAVIAWVCSGGKASCNPSGLAHEPPGML